MFVHPLCAGAAAGTARGSPAGLALLREDFLQSPPELCVLPAESPLPPVMTRDSVPALGAGKTLLLTQRTGSERGFRDFYSIFGLMRRVR